MVGPCGTSVRSAFYPAWVVDRKPPAADCVIKWAIWHTGRRAVAPPSTGRLVVADRCPGSAGPARDRPRDARHERHRPRWPLDCGALRRTRRGSTLSTHTARRRRLRALALPTQPL